MVEYIKKSDLADVEFAARQINAGPMRHSNMEGLFRTGPSGESIPVEDTDRARRAQPLIGEDPGYAREVFTADDEIWGDR